MDCDHDCPNCEKDAEIKDELVRDRIRRARQRQWDTYIEALQDAATPPDQRRLNVAYKMYMDLRF